MLAQVTQVVPGLGAITSIAEPRISADGGVGMTGQAMTAMGSLESFVLIDGGIAALASGLTPPMAAFGADLGLGMLTPGGGARRYATVGVAGGQSALLLSGAAILASATQAPGLPAGSLITQFGEVELDVQGRVHFTLNATGPGGQQRQAFCRYAAGEISPVLVSGQIVDGVPIDVPFGLMRPFDVAEGGQHYAIAAFTKADKEPRLATLIVDGHIAVRVGDPVKGRSFGDRWVGVNRVAVNNAGQYTMMGSTNASAGNNTVVTLGDAVVLNEGDVVQGQLLGSGFSPASVAIAEDGALASVWSLSFSSDLLVYMPSPVSLATAKVVLRAPAAVDTDNDGGVDAVLTRFEPLDQSNQLSIGAAGVHARVRLTELDGSNARIAAVVVAVP